MGGKGRKRREKNYRAAHGGNSRLPPPPKPSSVDALPSKLRAIMAFTHPSQSGSAVSNEKRNGGSGNRSEKGQHHLKLSLLLYKLRKQKVVIDWSFKRMKSVSELFIARRQLRYQVLENGRIRTDNVMPFVDIGKEVQQKKLNSKGKLDSNPTGTREKDNEGNAVTAQQVDDDDNIKEEKREKTKKRKRVTDLRFEMLESSGVSLKRREHRKKRLEAKKNKRKKARPKENEGFPGHEKIKFGEVVQAPPKLVSFPKASKAPQDASSERLRLKAVEAYRNRKGWASRPGKDLPPSIMTSPTL
ncbi:hypothetical protein RHMOL_Rhmol01G0156900 [Rhododendron molle]|uniref:Uncharacterized protein n=1 Tax=Rhododendron molle TaxID=49168 RepID=A0ACC0Q1K3_RHOML|nr:hypothetical protein RHMOL_Rhmol01G0156900 [Rhododendron molle]